jgi:adenylate cyclase
MECAGLIALSHGASRQVLGDAILAFFGDPETRVLKEDGIACVSMAIAMQTRMRELQVEWRDRGLQKPFQLREKENSSCEPWF